MGISSENPTIWDEIELAESYLICCMFGEASSSASSVIKRLLDYDDEGKQQTLNLEEDIVELNEMLESAGMVFVQSLKELLLGPRTMEILKELKSLFGSVSAIPVQVFLTGVCFQMQEDPTGALEFLKEYLGKWQCVDERYYVLASAKENLAYKEGCDHRSVVGVDKYLEVVEAYLTLLATVRSDMGHAVSWIEKAELPERKRQELLRRIHSIYSSKFTSSSQASVLSSLSDKGETNRTSVHSKSLEAQNPSSSGESSAKQAIIKLSGRRVPRFWWFRTFTLKIGKGRFVLSNGSVFLGCLMFLTYYILRRKQISIRRILMRHAQYMKKAVVDMWQLAFSYQVNPLAAVQPIPSTTPRGSRH
ncbi:hypothetical protein LguiA_007249 [Lonicera macranthoides]